MNLNIKGKFNEDSSVRQSTLNKTRNLPNKEYYGDEKSNVCGVWHNHIDDTINQSINQ